MSPQAATAMQSNKEPIIVKQFATGDVFDRIQQTNDSIARRAYEIFNNNGEWLGHELDDWFRAESELLHPIHLQIAESDDSLTVRAEAPGFRAKELSISLEPRKLMIAGKHEVQEESKNAKTIYSEWCAREILRVIDLPMEVDSSKASATLENGILTIELTKATHTMRVPSSLGATN